MAPATTFHLLGQIAAVDSRVVVVKLRRNFGQTSALAAGFDHAQGEYVIAMDGDLQHDPAEIPAFIAKINEGYDIVSGWRKKRIDNLLMRRIPSRCANWLMSKLSGVDLHDFGTTYKAYRRELIEEFRSMARACTASFPPWRRGMAPASARFPSRTSTATMVNRITASPALSAFSLT